MSTAEIQEELSEAPVDILDIPDEEIDRYLAEMEASSSEEEIEEEESATEEDSKDGEEVQEEEESNEDSEEEVSEQEESTENAATLASSKEFAESKLDQDVKIKEDTHTPIDYKAEYEKLVSPFKANGKEMQVDNIDDARTLMQMGANYNKKMAALKPSLKVAKMLEKHDLLDEDKISFLIDLSKKDPSAINKLIKDSGVDPLDLDTEQAEQYSPKAYTVNDKELELDAVLTDIRETPSFNITANIIGTKWDEKSKQVLSENPELIRVINDHVGTGIFDKISAVVERERVLGRLTGLSDIEAYKYVGDAINAKGGFNTQPNSISDTTNVKATNKVDPSLNSRKKAASSTKSTKTSTKTADNFNPLSMSDEEFEKIASSKFI